MTRPHFFLFPTSISQSHIILEITKSLTFFLDKESTGHAVQAIRKKVIFVPPVMCTGLTDSQLYTEGNAFINQYNMVTSIIALYAPCRSNSWALT